MVNLIRRQQLDYKLGHVTKLLRGSMTGVAYLKALGGHAHFTHPTLIKSLKAKKRYKISFQKFISKYNHDYLNICKYVFKYMVMPFSILCRAHDIKACYYNPS